MVYLLHLFATRARHIQGRMEKLLQKEIKNSHISGIRDELFSTPQLHGHVNYCKKIPVEESDTIVTFTT